MSGLWLTDEGSGIPDGGPTVDAAQAAAHRRWLMEAKLTSLSRRYQAALQKHLTQGPRASLRSADGLGREALTMGLETLGLARIHEQARIALVPPSVSAGTRDGMIKRAQETGS